MTVWEARAVSHFTTLSEAMRWQFRTFEAPSDLVMPSRNIRRGRSAVPETLFLMLALRFSRRRVLSSIFLMSCPLSST